MSKRTWLSGDTYRDTKDDGSMSSVHRVNSNFFGNDKCISVEEHHKNGTTTAYERSNNHFGGWKKK